jgi:Nif-specific regulatory protein
MAEGAADTDSAADRERVYYRRLLELGREGELSPLLEQALALIVDSTGARVAYLELHTDAEGDAGYWRGHGCTPAELSAIRATVSRGIIAAAHASGATVETPSAKDDPRFAERGSVRRHAIEAVLCVPVGRPPLGVLYLQGLPQGAGFTTSHREWAELFASQLALVAERIKAPWRAGDELDHTVEIRRRFACPGLVGRSRALARVLAEAASMAPLDVGVLLTGPAGTGKSVLARAIHDNSRRAGKPFVAINCGAIPLSLIESELFGVERGAHTTAAQRTVGKVGAARGGTLFLDEIGDLPYDAQSKLLQLLQERQYYPVGSSQIVNADVRVLAATNLDLRERLERQQFRPDLYYRLNVVTIEMPGLAERRDDLPTLAVHLLGEMCARHGLPALELARATLLAIQDEPWPGQIRELANVVEAGAIRAAAEPSTVVRPQHLYPARAEPSEDVPLDYREATRRFQRRFVLDVLTEHDWDIAAATRLLGVARSHLYNLISTFDLKRPR